MFYIKVPIPIRAHIDDVVQPQYDFLYSRDSTRDDLFSFRIQRKLDKAILFDTSLGGLVLNDRFLQIVTRLQSPHVYGFGENNHDTLKHNVTERKSWGIFARDQGAYKYLHTRVVHDSFSRWCDHFDQYHHFRN